MSNTTYVLNSLGWTLGGAAVASVYWRVYFHRKLVALGAAAKEPPLMIFTATIVVAVTSMGLLFGEANRTQLDDYVQCQAKVNQNNVNTINDRSASAITQLERQIEFYVAFQSILGTQASSVDLRARALVLLNMQIANQRQRLAFLKTSALQPISDCKIKRNGQ